MWVYYWSDTWLPNEHTLAYYPLNSTTTVNDLSGNNKNLTNAWNVTFWTNYWVNCAYFNWTQNGMLVQNNISFNAYPTYTASVRMYITTNSAYNTIYVIGSVMETGALWSWYKRGTWLSLSWWSPNWEVIKSWNIDWWWHLLTNVVNWSNAIQYLDWQQYQTLTNLLSGTQTVLCLWVPANFHQDNVLTWSLSNFILEDKVRTAQDVADYYDKIKSQYWIS